MSRRYNTRRPARRSRGALNLNPLVVIAIVLAALAVGYAAQRSCDSPADKSASSDSESDLPQDARWGDLTAVKGAPADGRELHYNGFDVNFNSRYRVPNYVVWELTPEKAAAQVADRKDSEFTADPNVDGSADPADYRRSGYDRGHMVPAADMKWSRRAMDDCHYMTNVAPQSGQLNRGTWQTVEDNCRSWTKKFGRLVIICGPVLSDRPLTTIGKGVAVPERFFKVVLAPDADPPMAIGFIMSNFDQTGGAQAAATSVDEVEAVTGYDFFSALPDDIENEVEAQASYASWQYRHRKRK